MSVKMPQLVNVKCDICGYLDQAYWSEFGAEQPCLACDASPIDLIRVA